MSTNNMGFYEEAKSSLNYMYHQISSITHLISSSLNSSKLCYDIILHVYQLVLSHY